MDLVLLYGGTFDPVHEGHLAVARAARDELGATVHLLPAADPPHRAATGADATQRAHMLELAITDGQGRDEPGLVVDRRELARAGASYTVDTLREVRAELGPDAPLAWITGDDSFRSLPDWHGWEALFDLAHFVVALRPGHSLDALPPVLARRTAARWVERPEALRATPAGALYRLHFPPRPESASAIRRDLAEGRTPAGLPATVEAFIRVTGLYAPGV
jgi:nicotinate-nucleotide adenylyltransferase